MSNDLKKTSWIFAKSTDFSDGSLEEELRQLEVNMKKMKATSLSFYHTSDAQMRDCAKRETRLKIVRKKPRRRELTLLRKFLMFW